ncbi:MAG: hybrid sensor histidine kinase/response regulator [Nitrospinae bacterium]|nr:hybrid sensor histidine kinase/response regulator [Nitrospinota bacterium]
MDARILVTDDEESVRFTLKTFLLEEGYKVDTATDYDEALIKISEKDFDLIFTDIILENKTGIDILREAKEKNPNCLVVMITGSPDVDSASAALRLGAFDYIVKPLRQPTILHVAAIALKQKALTDEKDRYRLNLESTNKELNIINEKLKEMDRQKTEFLNIVTHDIRNPLTAIKLYIEMLLKYKDEPDTIQKVYEEYLTIAKKASIRLENLVSDYLDLTKLEAGQMRFRQEPVDIKYAINDTIQIYEGEAIEKGISLKSNFGMDGEIPVIVGDDGKIRQVVSNLLGNAIKFTPEGGTVTASVLRKEDFVEICVEDTGPGIPTEYHEKIFEKFVQVEEGNEKVKKGTGLGLQIVKNIVDHHGGRVWVESEEERGARFVAAFPIKQMNV